jgi:hypothetical protein
MAKFEIDQPILRQGSDGKEPKDNLFVTFVGEKSTTIADVPVTVKGAGNEYYRDMYDRILSAKKDGQLVLGLLGVSASNIICEEIEFRGRLR